ncbi:unnamed protein product [Sphagnum jensenii]|uniref:LMBR1-like membrane protein n=1 Tax=Sphagnum jensenii TaxID=128206 RepID=A0ABP1A9Z1_9BRYO
MWVFYALAGPIALGMVVATLQYFAASTVPLYVRWIVGYAWFCTISIIILVPADIWTTVSYGSSKTIGILWSWSYWSTFILTWFLVPLLQGYEDAGDFTVANRLKTSAQGNLMLYGAVGAVSMIGVFIMVFMGTLHWNKVLGVAIACSNTFGLVTGAFLLGFGLVEIPRSMWRNADLQYRQKVLSHKIAKAAVKLDDAHQELSTAIVIAQATSNQMARHDSLRPCMDVIDEIMTEMVREDPMFKPSGGRMGESDMDYDTDEKSMAALKRRLLKAQSAYYRYKSDYSGYVWEALELEETVKNLERGTTASDWCFASSIQPVRTGSFATILSKVEYVWRCILRQHLVKVLAATLGIMSVAIVMAEATLLFEADLSLFSVILRMVDEEVLLQVVAFVPLAYMCVCTYFSLIRLGMMTIYYLAPKHTSSVSLLMLCSMVARYAAPLCYNFLYLIRLRTPDGKPSLTVFETRMGAMTDTFNRIYPLFMVIYTGLLASNVLDRVMGVFGSWRKFRNHDVEDAQGFDQSGLIILRKERSWLEQGNTVGENVVPLARNFGSAELDLESNTSLIKNSSKISSSTSVPPSLGVAGTRNQVPSSEGRVSSRDTFASKYANLWLEHSKQAAGKKMSQGGEMLSSSSAKPSTLIDLHAAPSNPTLQRVPTDTSSSTLFSLRWDSMKSGFQNFGTRFAPLRQEKGNSSSSSTSVLPSSSSQTLDSIFQGLQARRDPNKFRVLVSDED